MRASEITVLPRPTRAVIASAINHLIPQIRKTVPLAKEIWLHGSRARGNNRVTSDIDILVLVSDSIPSKEYSDIAIKLQQLAQVLNPVAVARYKTIDFDIQLARSSDNIYRIAQEEGQQLWPQQATAQ